MLIENYRIYGDNILECEKTLNLIYRSILLQTNRSRIETKHFHAFKRLVKSKVYVPKYEILTDKTRMFFQLIPGYGRWSTDILDYLNSLGSELSENPDSIVTRLTDNNSEEILFGCEYCGALPAGNNAWQRSGRALMFSKAHIPFLYYSEIGGMELDVNRNFTAGRIPNPLVPLSYITTNEITSNTLILPIYNPSPTISCENLQTYSNCFVRNEDLIIVYKILMNTSPNSNYTSAISSLYDKATLLTQKLISNRKCTDTISSSQLTPLINCIRNSSTYDFFIANNESWTKSITIPLTKTMKEIFDYCKDNCISMGSKTLPFCIVPNSHKINILNIFKSNYSRYDDVISNIESSEKPLALVWIAGFKPSGKDSRPDRGLLPLFKMLFGNEYTTISFVYGPMKNQAINQLNTAPQNLFENNGLWKSIFTHSNFIIVDGYVALNRSLTNIHFIDVSTLDLRTNSFCYNHILSTTTPRLGEDDVDTTIHSLFRTIPQLLPISTSKRPLCSTFENICNPPGGDWSGVEVIDFENLCYYRWSSLPRVSGENKRPDHVIQFQNKFLIIESKLLENTLENNIGPKLRNYVNELFCTPPTSYKCREYSNWILNINQTTCEVDFDSYDYITGVAFSRTSGIASTISSNSVTASDYNYIFDSCSVDTIFILDFIKDIVHISILCKNQKLIDWLNEIILYNYNIQRLLNLNIIRISIL